MERFKKRKKIICAECGKEIIPGNDAEGIPNGVGFEKDGKIINICKDCIIEIGRGRRRYS